MAQKWIINNDQILISSSVGYHRELSKDHSTTRGGGMWRMVDGGLYLYGRSSDFGATTKETLQEVINKDWIFQERFAGKNIYFSHLDEFEYLAQVDNVKLEMPANRFMAWKQTGKYRVEEQSKTNKKSLHTLALSDFACCELIWGSPL